MGSALSQTFTTGAAGFQLGKLDLQYNAKAPASGSYNFNLGLRLVDVTAQGGAYSPTSTNTNLFSFDLAFEPDAVTNTNSILELTLSGTD